MIHRLPYNSIHTLRGARFRDLSYVAIHFRRFWSANEGLCSITEEEDMDGIVVKRARPYLSWYQNLSPLVVWTKDPAVWCPRPLRKHELLYKDMRSRTRSKLKIASRMPGECCAGVASRVHSLHCCWGSTIRLISKYCLHLKLTGLFRQ